MVAATTSCTATLNLEPETLSSAGWRPTGDDHLIFEWVKMQGKTQREVAGMFGIDQSTVSRIIQRVERWQAHAKARENGRLDPQERLRAQRWLTYERNELILASCLRIAQEMEGFADVSKSTIHRPTSSPSKETEIRTEHARVDRSGVAARFLRLAYRINMDQLKLAALFAREGEAPAEPLSDEELAEEARLAAADAAELAAARRRADDQAGEWARQNDGEMEEQKDTGAEQEHSQEINEFQPSKPERPKPEPANLVVAISPSLPPSVLPQVPQSPPPPVYSAVLNPEPRTLNPPLHNLHNENAPKIDTSAAQPCTCASQPGPEKNSLVPCITDCNQPPWPGDETPKGVQRPLATAARS